ncbi:MAG: hypothetical protein AAGG07_05170 [Planctomycetota bacterium]
MTDEDSLVAEARADVSARTGVALDDQRMLDELMRLMPVLKGIDDEAYERFGEGQRDSLEACRWKVQEASQHEVREAIDRILALPGFVYPSEDDLLRMSPMLDAEAWKRRSRGGPAHFDRAAYHLAPYLSAELRVASTSGDFERVRWALEAAEHVSDAYAAQVDFSSWLAASLLYHDALPTSISLIQDPSVDLAAKRAIVAWWAGYTADVPNAPSLLHERTDQRYHIAEASHGMRGDLGAVVPLLGDRLGEHVHERKRAFRERPVHEWASVQWSNLSLEELREAAGDPPDKGLRRTWDRLIEAVHREQFDYEFHRSGGSVSEPIGAAPWVWPALALDALPVILAIEAHAAEIGVLPTSLEVVEGAGVKVPIDPFDPEGGSLRYRVLDEPDDQGRRYLLYSVRTDGDDDVGVEADGSAWFFRREPQDGDAIVN